ncbi:MAG: flagellar basal body L-ring protein FlgH [Spirochaetia bacterium]|jgi:flagellar basal body L-ring protein FlgH|nr:flagellar basal body L-ring protein FlgH [Spirochaetia bacterium]
MRDIRKIAGFIFILCLPLSAATIWQDKNNYVAAERFAQGDVIVINVRDISTIQFDVTSQSTDNLSIESNPDVTITGFLPKAAGDKKIKGDESGKFSVKGKVGFSIAAQVQEVQNGKLVLTGSRVYVFNGVINTITVSGIADPILLSGREVDSWNVANFQIQITGRRRPINLQFAPPAVEGQATTEFTEQQKQQLIIEYLQKIITEQAKP